MFKDRIAKFHGEDYATLHGEDYCIQDRAQFLALAQQIEEELQTNDEYGRRLRGSLSEMFTIL